LVLLIGFGAKAYNFVWDSWIQQYFLDLAFDLYDLSAFYQRLIFMLLQLLLQKMHILMAWCETLLNICGFLLTVEDGYDSKSCLYFEAQICQVQDSFECIQEAPSKDSIIRVCYVDHIKGNVFSSGILRCAEGHRKCDGSDRFDSFSTEAIERLRQFFELLPIESHFIEGC
jgi:hypothetical protein